MNTMQIRDSMPAFHPQYVSVKILGRTILTVAMALLVCGQVEAKSPQATTAALGLPRLRAQISDGSAPVARGKFTEDPLSARGMAGVRNGEKRGAKFLIIDGQKDWSRPLRGKPNDLLFVSFSAYGSPGTIIDVGGARLSVAESIVPGCAQLMALDANGEWQPTALNVPFDFYDKKVLGCVCKINE